MLTVRGVTYSILRSYVAGKNFYLAFSSQFGLQPFSEAILLRFVDQFVPQELPHRSVVLSSICHMQIVISMTDPALVSFGRLNRAYGGLVEDSVGAKLHLGITGLLLCSVSALLGYLAVKPTFYGPLFLFEDDKN